MFENFADHSAGQNLPPFVMKLISAMPLFVSEWTETISTRTDDDSTLGVTSYMCQKKPSLVLFGTDKV